MERGRRVTRTPVNATFGNGGADARGHHVGALRVRCGRRSPPPVLTIGSVLINALTLASIRPPPRPPIAPLPRGVSCSIGTSSAPASSTGAHGESANPLAG